MNQSIKIAHIITGLGVGGAEMMLKRILLSDTKSKESIIVISLTDIGKIGLALEAQGFTVYCLMLNKIHHFPRDFWRLLGLIKMHKPEVVQTWMYHADLLGGLAAYLAGCRHIVWGIRRTLAPLNQTKTYGIMRLCALLSHFIPKKIICVAEAAKKAHSHYGYNEKKMHVIPNGYDFKSFDLKHMDINKIKERLGVAPTDFIIGCIGRYHSDKGQDIFIQAVALLDVSLKQKIRFMLVGRNCDAHNSNLVHLINSQGLEEQFMLLGERDDVPACLAAMDVFCMPSRSEGFPNGLAEAMAMEKPCVATLVGDVALLADNSVLLVAPEDPKALSEALARMINMDLETRTNLGKQAALQVRNNYSIDKARERFYALYREMLECTN